MKKMIWITISILCFQSFISYFASASNSTLIVDNEGDGDFVSIKDALAHALPGDTIEVYSGIYYEQGLNINVNEITLKGISYELGNGSDIGKPYIDGEGMNYVFYLNACNITLDGFHIENNPGGFHDIIDISINAEGCIISNNDLNHTGTCFIYVTSSRNKIINNTINHSIMRQGICLGDPSQDNFVSGNSISNCDTGILLWDSSYNLITKNIIKNCSEFGIDNTYIYNTFQYNTLKDNEVGYQTLTGVYNSIINNNFIDNQVHAQYQYNRFRSCFSNRWIGNFWDAGRILPYPIVGQILFFPWIQFDWNPANVPN